MLSRNPLNRMSVMTEASPDPPGMGSGPAWGSAAEYAVRHVAARRARGRSNPAGRVFIPDQPWTRSRAGWQNMRVSPPASPVPPPGTTSASGRFLAVPVPAKPLWLVPPRVVLQRRASRTLLMHALRATSRIFLLVVADIAA